MCFAKEMAGLEEKQEKKIKERCVSSSEDSGERKIFL